MGCAGGAHPDLLGPPRNPTRAPLPCLPSSAAQHGVQGRPGGLGHSVLPTSPFPGPAGLVLLMSTVLLPPQPFTTQRARAHVSLTSAPCCWQHGPPALPGLTRMDRGTFLALQRPFNPPGRAPGQGQHLRVQREPGQSYPHYGLCPASVGCRRYLLPFVCKYRKDVVLFTPSICLSILS